MKGLPSLFQCKKCRSGNQQRFRQGDRSPPPGNASRIRWTGRTRPYPTTGSDRRRSLPAKEYECLDCGHRGWSALEAIKRAKQGLPL